MTTRLQPATCGTTTRSAGFSTLTGNRGPLEALVARAAGYFTVLQVWNKRARSRRELGYLDDRMLDDIGVSRAEAAHEAAKWLWED